MQQPSPPGVLPHRTPSFYLTGRQPLRPAAILLATVAAVTALSSVLYALEHNRPATLASENSTASSASTPSGATADDDKDDPNQIDTIVLGDPADAPVPARRGDHVSPVHPTILIRLPRFGDQVGLIPNTPAGHLLYDWLAAFNHPGNRTLDNTPGNALPGIPAAEQIELRQMTGGFTLLSAKEVKPGVLVFRLHDQTPTATEVLGTLQLRPSSNPAAIETFSLRSVSPLHQVATAASLSTTSPQ